MKENELIQELKEALRTAADNIGGCDHGGWEATRGCNCEFCGYQRIVDKAEAYLIG